MNYMLTLKFSAVLIVFLVFALQFFTPLVFAEVSQNQASSALANAEASLTSSYQAISKADYAGANVSSLLVSLNEAGWFLARARMAYNSGDFNSALGFASQSQEKSSGLAADADALRETAIQEYYFDFSVNVIGSILGSVGVVCVSFFVWFFMRKKIERAGGIA